VASVPTVLAEPVRTRVVPLESLDVPPELSATDWLLSPTLPGNARRDANAVFNVLFPVPKLIPERPRARPMLFVGAFWSARANELLALPLKSSVWVVVVVAFVPVAVALPVLIDDVPSELFDTVPVLVAIERLPAPAAPEMATGSATARLNELLPMPRLPPLMALACPTFLTRDVDPMMAKPFLAASPVAVWLDCVDALTPPAVVLPVEMSARPFDRFTTFPSLVATEVLARPTSPASACWSPTAVLKELLPMASLLPVTALARPTLSVLFD